MFQHRELEQFLQLGLPSFLHSRLESCFPRIRFDEFDFLFNDVKKDLVFVDTIYNPLQTKMIKHFKKKNIKTYNGLDMFIYQGQKSFYLWNKINPEVNDELTIVSPNG